MTPEQEQVRLRESLGQKVREVWITWSKEQPNPKPSWLLPWNELTEPEREVDRRIGEAIAAQTQSTLQAKLDSLAIVNTHLKAKLLASEAAGAARLKALQNARPKDEYDGAWDELSDALSTTCGTAFLAERERYVKTLEFYADEKNWENRQYSQPLLGGWSSPSINDRGKKAREAIKEK